MDLGARWRLEAWGSRTWRPEERTYRLSAAPDVAYEDRAWSGQAALRYRAPSGFHGSTALEIDLRDVIRGEGEVPQLERLGRHNTRARLEAGWHLGRRFSATLGFRLDLDGDSYTNHGRFDGAHGRFMIRW